MPKTIDAIKIHCDRPGSKYRRGRLGEILRKIREAYGAAMGCDRPHLRDQGQFFYVSPNPADTLLFPVGHDLEYQDRYTWSTDPDDPCVELGVLVPEAVSPSPLDAAPPPPPPPAWPSRIEEGES